MEILNVGGIIHMDKVPLTLTKMTLTFDGIVTIMMKWIVRLVTHGIAGVVGFALGIYLLPILIAPASPDETEVRSAALHLLRPYQGPWPHQTPRVALFWKVL